MTTQAIPIVNDTYLDINGLQLTWSSTTVIRIENGTARDSTNTNDISVNNVTNEYVTVTTTVSGVGGLDTGTIADSTLYYVFAIGSSLGQAPGAGLISLSETAPVLPYNYDMFRRVGAVLTDGSAHYLEFQQTGNYNSTLRRMWYDAGIQVLNGGASATFAEVALDSYMPTYGFGTSVLLNAVLTPTGNGNTATIQPNGASSATGYIVIGGSQAGVAMNVPVEVPCDSGSNIAYKVTGTLTLDLRAYDDQL
jgi:hypothetical protein